MTSERQVITEEIADALKDELATYGIQVAASFALPKIVHMLRNVPDLASRCRRVVHQTDWIVAALCGRYDVTDVSTALKTGVNPGSLKWPPVIESLGLPLACLPDVVLPGTPLGTVTDAAESLTGIPAGTPVIAGCTDGTAGCLASGARQVGDLNVTLGTTLVFKAIAEHPCATQKARCTIIVIRLAVTCQARHRVPVAIGSRSIFPTRTSIRSVAMHDGIFRQMRPYIHL